MRYARVLSAALGALWALAMAGCSEKIQRENVLATTQSAIGVMLAQNAQTQAYELKVGFARNEFFLVPTSKRVVNDADDNDAAGTREDPTKIASVEHNDPTGTPEVLAEIQVGGKGKQTIGPNGVPEQGGGVEVYQRLAVGKIAVRSGAAIALMSQNAETAKAAAGVRLGTGDSERAVSLKLNVIEDMARLLKDSDDKQGRALADAVLGNLWDEVSPARKLVFYQFDGVPPNKRTAPVPDAYQQMNAPIPGITSLGRLKDFRARLDSSIAAIGAALQGGPLVGADGAAVTLDESKKADLRAEMAEQIAEKDHVQKAIGSSPAVGRMVEYFSEWIHAPQSEEKP